jgi:hypothetical protein
LTTEGQEQGKLWTKFLADFMFRLKYTANGNVSCKGIQKPICVGDNAVIGDMLFHIESISHDGTIDMAGKKRFNTSLALSHGIRFNESVTQTPDNLRS